MFDVFENQTSGKYCECAAGLGERSKSVFLQWLLDQSILGGQDKEHILRVAGQTGEPFDLVICKLGLLTETQLISHLSTYTGLQRLSEFWGGQTIAPSAAFRGKINRVWLEENRVMPLYEERGWVICAVVNPLASSIERGLFFALGKPILFGLVTQSEWEVLFSRSEQHEEDNGANASLSFAEYDVSADVERLKDMASAEPVVRLVNRLLSEASKASASDIHLEPGARDVGVRFRVDGHLGAHEALSASQGISAISRIKILASLDIAERRRPQDGRFSFPVAGRSIDLRVSTVPTDHGESLVIRLLDQSRVQLDLEELGFFPDSIKTVTDCLDKPHGILLVTGPTGSGKTTTLYTFLKSLTTGEKKILTIEDPIEYRLDGVNQSQVNASIGVTFASALRSFLRHDPDVMMVGEIRDLETATIAVQAALTGHLVLSTLHTNDAPSAITRLRDIGVEDYLISSTLIGVFAQRLVRRTCSVCRGVKSTSPSKDNACVACQDNGFKGRLALVEALPIDQTMQKVIHDGGDIASILQSDQANSFVSMHEDGHRKVQAGLTTVEEVRKATGHQEVNAHG
ncbi:MAG: GspE/PulE family protein [Pseudomonadota bacterium]